MINYQKVCMSVFVLASPWFSMINISFLLHKPIDPFSFLWPPVQGGCLVSNCPFWGVLPTFAQVTQSPRHEQGGMWIRVNHGRSAFSKVDSSQSSQIRLHLMLMLFQSAPCQKDGDVSHQASSFHLFELESISLIWGWSCPGRKTGTSEELHLM